MTESTVQKILKAVEKKGDAALLNFTRRFDRFHATARNIEVARSERRSAWKRVDPQIIRALKNVAQRIRRFHEKQRPKDYLLKESGILTGLRWGPLDRVGIYIPGGRAAYPSTVLMNAIPASVAGVSEIVMVTPTPEGILNPAVLVAADLSGVHRIFRVGGAQAIAALAFGTKTIPKVDKIVGPGNRFVAEAKRQVFGIVGIDSIAGPSEVVILADNSANPTWIAADLIAQAEHDPEAIPLVLSPSRPLLTKIRREVERRIKLIPRRKIAEAAFIKNGDAIWVRDLEAGCDWINRRAPEHVEIQTGNPRKWAKKIRHAGAIFLGPFSPVAAGDYGVGPNHVLPTGGTARFSSPLGVHDFMKATSVIEIKYEALKRLAQTTETLARMEGLTGHAESVEVRFQ